MAMAAAERNHVCANFGLEAVRRVSRQQRHDERGKWWRRDAGHRVMPHQRNSSAPGREM